MKYVCLGSVTDLKREHRNKNALIGSHGGMATGQHAIAHNLRGLICHDAGIGMDEAGVAGLIALDKEGVPGLAVCHDSARVGDPQDMFARGVISRVNSSARAIGADVGLSVSEALSLLEATDPDRASIVSSEVVVSSFNREVIHLTDADLQLDVTLIDSASLMNSADDSTVIVSGSHGGLPGNQRTRAVKALPAFVIFNDAGIGIDDAGFGRLVPLDEHQIPAACVSASSARIGDARSTFTTGVISKVNEHAASLNVRPGMTAQQAIVTLLRNSPLVTK